MSDHRDSHVAQAEALQRQRAAENAENLNRQIAETRTRLGRDLTWKEYMRLPLPEAEAYFNHMLQRNEEKEES